MRIQRGKFPSLLILWAILMLFGGGGESPAKPKPYKAIAIILYNEMNVRSPSLPIGPYSLYKFLKGPRLSQMWGNGGFMNDSHQSPGGGFPSQMGGDEKYLSGEDLQRFGRCSNKWFDLRCDERRALASVKKKIATVVVDVSGSFKNVDPLMMGNCARARALNHLKNNHHEVEVWGHAENLHGPFNLADMTSGEIMMNFCANKGGNNLVSLLNRVKKLRSSSDKPLVVITDIPETGKQLDRWLSQNQGVTVSLSTENLPGRLLLEVQ